MNSIMKDIIPENMYKRMMCWENYQKSNLKVNKAQLVDLCYKVFHLPFRQLPHKLLNRNSKKISN